MVKIITKYISSPCIIIGDFNLNCFDYDSDSNISKYCETLFSLGLSPLISRTTHRSNTSNTLIDQIWSNYFTDTSFTNVIDSSVLKHLPLTYSVPLSLINYIDNTDRNLSTKFLFHNVSPANIERFGKEFIEYYENFTDDNINNNNHDSNFYDVPINAQTNFSSFFSTFKHLYDNHIVEEIDLNKSKRNHYFKPWITIAIAKSCAVKNALYSRWTKARGSPEETLAMNEYKSYRTRLRQIIRARKMDYFKDKFARCSGNIKKSWQIINEIRCKKKKLTLPDHITLSSGEIIIDRRNICNHFNNYFTKVADNLNKEKYDNYVNEVPDYRKFLKNPVSNTIFMTPAGFSEIYDHIKNLNSGKSSDFSPRVLKLFNFQF